MSAQDEHRLKKLALTIHVPCPVPVVQKKIRRPYRPGGSVETLWSSELLWSHRERHRRRWNPHHSDSGRHRRARRHTR